jgi:hypothetical protein
MKLTSRLFVILFLFAAKAAAHPTVLPHAHPHTEEAGTMNSAIVIGGLTIVAGLAWYANWRLAKNSKAKRPRR